MIFRIFADMQWFMFLIIIMIFYFAYTFYILGQNQMQFDNIQQSQLAELPIAYTNYLGAIYYMIDLFFGNTNMEYFSYGDGANFLMLYAIYVISLFLIVIHLLNMLIAIMGNTFA